MLAEFQNISKQYDHPVLKEISLTIHRGDSIAIVGPSGSGKSTLLNILGTLDRPSSGRVILNGQVVDKLDDNQLAGIRNRFIGFVFQLHYLLPQLTLLENILLPMLPVKDKLVVKEAEQRAYKLLDRVGLNDRVTHLPGELSVGECQRAAVVRALINNPGLLLADEPTGSLDEASAASLGILLGELNREEEMGMVVVTHSMEIARRMKVIYKLHSGRLEKIDQP
ncbi:MAG: ABC transporter ATP-binding protein [Bacteroidales bacterium]|nr:ABC transporter ATP-binding protein [Bacteroidota bacterium]MBL6949207.1 ABC transporter ATP-binding protein [Bacteroidales bacterium]